jgi:hypothetical protein
MVRPPSKHLLTRVVLLVVGITGVTVACGVGEGSEFERVPSPIPLGLDETLPPTTLETTTTTDAVTTSSGFEQTTTTVSSESVLMYFISRGQLTAVPVPLTPDPTLFQVVARLQGGPPAGDEFVGLRSAVPQTVLIDVIDDRTGVATVVLPPRFFDRIVASEQRLAIGQIVLTLLNRPSFGQVRFESGGEPIEVPKGSGELAEAGEALSVGDYDNLLLAPSATTSTSSTVPNPATPVEVATTSTLPLFDTTTSSSNP